MPSLSGYDVLIHLRPELVPHAAERLGADTRKHMPSDPQEDTLVPVVEFHVVRNYLQELQVILNSDNSRGVRAEIIRVTRGCQNIIWGDTLYFVMYPYHICTLYIFILLYVEGSPSD